MDEIGDLAQSIRIFGIIQPLLVCPGRNESGKFTLISGRRRLEAARMAGLKEVPVIVRKATNQEILELSISENIHHLAVTPFDLAHSYMRMANEFELSIEEISTRISRSCHSVANTMKMLALKFTNCTATGSSFARTAPMTACNSSRLLPVTRTASP